MSESSDFYRHYNPSYPDYKGFDSGEYHQIAEIPEPELLLETLDTPNTPLPSIYTGENQTRLTPFPVILSKNQIGGEIYFPFPDQPLAQVEYCDPQTRRRAGYFTVHSTHDYKLAGFLHGPDGDVLFADDNEDYLQYMLTAIKGIETARQIWNSGTSPFMILEQRAHQQVSLLNKLDQLIQHGLTTPPEIVHLIEQGKLPRKWHINGNFLRDFGGGVEGELFEGKLRGIQGHASLGIGGEISVSGLPDRVVDITIPMQKIGWSRDNTFIFPLSPRARPKIHTGRHTKTISTGGPGIIMTSNETFTLSEAGNTTISVRQITS